MKGIFIMNSTPSSKILLLLVVTTCMWIACSTTELIKPIFDTKLDDASLSETNAKNITINSDLLVLKQNIIFTNGHTVKTYNTQTGQTSTIDLSETMNSNLASNCSYSVKIHAVDILQSECWLTFCINQCSNPLQVKNCLLFVVGHYHTYVDSELIPSKQQPHVHQINKSNRVIILSMPENSSKEIPNGDVQQLEAEITDTDDKHSPAIKIKTDTTLETQFSPLAAERRENVYISASKIIKTADGRSLLVSIVVDSTSTIKGSKTVFFSSVISDVSLQTEKERKDTIRVLKGHCSITRVGEPCILYKEVTGKISEVSISKTMVLLSINKTLSLIPFSFCAFTIDELINNYDQCCSNQAKCVINAIDTLSQKHTRLQLSSFSAYNSDGLDMALAAMRRNYPDGRISLQRFQIYRETFSASDPLDMNIHWNPPSEKNSISNIRIEQEYNYGAFIFNNTAVFQVNELKPMCSEATNCFQCQSNLFNLGFRCAWKDRRCSESTKTQKTAACKPEIEKVEPPFILTSKNSEDEEENTKIFVNGNGFSNAEYPKLMCHRNSEDEETSQANRNKIISIEANEATEFKLEFILEHKDLINVQFLNCSISFSQQNFNLPEGFTIEQSEIPLPSNIPILQPRIKHVYPKYAPFSTGFLLSVEGENLWNGVCYYPHLSLQQRKKEVALIKRTFFKSRNKVTFLIDAPSYLGLNEKENVYFKLISVHKVEEDSLHNIIIKEPKEISVVQNSTLRQGGVDIVFRGNQNGVASIPEPRMIIKLNKESDNECVYTSDEQKCTTRTRAETNMIDLHCTVPSLDSVINETNTNSTYLQVALKSSEALTSYPCNNNTITCGFEKNLLSESPSDNRIYIIETPIVHKIKSPNSLKVSTANDRWLNISFDNMNTKWLQYGIVQVKIGHEEQCNIYNYTNTSLTCKTPKQTSGKQQGIYVYIGTEYSVRVGTFYYEQSKIFLFYITVGCSCAFLIIFLFISLILYLHRRRKYQKTLDPKAGTIEFNKSPENVDPISLLPEEERELLEEFTNNQGLHNYAAQRISPMLICPIVKTPIGHGQFGEVYRATLRIPQTDVENLGETITVALKCVRKRKSLQDNKEIWKQLLQEGESMTDFSHKNVLGMLGFSYIFPPSQQQAEFCIVLPFMNSGNLHSHIRKYGKNLSNHMLIDFSFQAALGMEYLHQRQILHQDLAARNCMLNIDENTKEHNLKVADFGLSTDANIAQKANVLPIMWCSPEILRAEDTSKNGDQTRFPIWTKEADVWAYGILVWEIFHDAKNPYYHMAHKSTNELKSLIAKCQARPVIGAHVEIDTIIEIMQLCWQTTPENRPTFSEICSQLETLCQLANKSDDFPNDTGHQNNRHTSGNDEQFELLQTVGTSSRSQASSQNRSTKPTISHNTSQV